MIQGPCQLEFEGCKRETRMMFEIGPLMGRGPSRRACSSCYCALIDGKKSAPEPPRKHVNRLPNVPSKQRSMIK